MSFQFTKLKCLVMSPLIIFLGFLIVSSTLTPYFISSGLIKYAEFVNTIPGVICHQLPSRCYFLFGSNIALCTRCYAFYSSMLIFSIGYLFVKLNLERHHKLILFYLLIAPLIIDGTTQYFNLRESNNFIRTATGLMAGIGTSIILIQTYSDRITYLLNKFLRS